MEDLHTK